ncbi:unnamed protein product [Rotaria sordida]|uniref:Uncharacterized protein n=2 Tax=Rotaria sordida TaxID=392033 RepID=A0A814IAV6_9BILA|nr:unnamed protein product [Rotaria sordida]CAF1021411.1 unnamed protein product [Rotaria sordida]
MISIEKNDLANSEKNHVILVGGSQFASDNRTCFQPGTVCVQHPRCHSRPVCYPSKMAQICPSIPTTTMPSICLQAKWSSNGITVAGGNGAGDALNQLQFPVGVVVDHKDDSIYISDEYNSRVMKWIPDAKSGIVVAGGNGRGNESNMLNTATQIFLDKKDGSLLICDQVNKRVQRWRKNSTNGETIFSNIPCVGLAMDSEGSFYATEWDDSRVTKWYLGDTKGQIVAGGNGKGSGLDQFDHPSYLFVDQNQTLFIADQWNNRIIKWLKDAKQGIVVAGDNDEGQNMNQLIFPTSVIVDQLGTLYITDTNNNRLQRWFKDATSANVTIVGGIEEESGHDRLSFPNDVAFDRHGNLYVVDHYNHRVQMFKIDISDCQKSIT